MSRRRRDEGASLESDSFLDIVANIVGILIILIVVTCVRVGQSAAAPADEEEPAAPAVAAAPVAPPARLPVVAPRPVFVQAPAAKPVIPPGPSPVLVAAVDAEAAEIAALRQAEAAATADLERLGATAAAGNSDLQNAFDAGRSVAAALAAAEDGARSLVDATNALRAELDGVNRQLTDMPAKNVTVLKHQLNPIGREVEGKELHYRLEGGRVARIPIDELIERLKPQIEKQKDWIAKFRRHQGTVGPIDGFRMVYVVERQRPSVVDELRYGQQMMRVVVSGWKVEADPDLRGETADEALRRGSRFLASLRLADRGATVTMWVYPDSFELYRRLQDMAHADGLAVAARPLPFGVPIAGSPNGSKSTSQ